MSGKRIGVLAGAFNPMTSAHLALADAAAAVVDEIVCAIPRKYPHKELHGATIEDRTRMIEHSGGPYKVVVCEGGLFIEIARELRREYGDDSEIFFICGRDAAERVVSWDYGQPGAIDRMLEEFQLLVAAREGHYVVPAHLRNRILRLDLPRSYDEVSSTEIRDRIDRDERWEHLVPEGIISLVREIYGSTPPQPLPARPVAHPPSAEPIVRRRKTR